MPWVTPVFSQEPMSKKPYSWLTGAVLEEHSRRKHKVIGEYFARYLAVRCQLPQQSRFRLAIVDGFAGGGLYKCGSPGSPLVFINELRVAAEQFNIKRQDEGMSPLDIECLLVLNDFDEDTIELLKKNAASLIAEISANVPRLHLRVEYRNKKFDELYPEVKQLLERGSYRNVLFNLDQCGTGSVEISTISDIVASFTSVEIFYTFGIQTLLAFLHQTNRAALAKQLAPFGVNADHLSQLDALMSKDTWLGAAERIVFDSFRRCASYVSPFSIHNPGRLALLAHSFRKFGSRSPRIQQRSASEQQRPGALRPFRFTHAILRSE
ncbi:three-Cys-motif partner protein [Bradyrhizobium sp. F1.13.1]